MPTDSICWTRDCSRVTCAIARLFGRELLRIPAGQTVVVDEVQRLPALLNEVHRFIESHGLRFVLLGSSARKLKQAGTNLLAGRALRRVMFPLLPQELGADFDLAEVLRFGSLPVIWQSPAKAESLEAYVQLYLKQEIQAEALVRNLPGFARFLPVAALFHGQVLSVAGVGPRRGGGADHGLRLPGDSGRHLPGVAAAGLRRQVAGQGTEAPQTLLGGPGRHAGGEAGVPSAGRSGARRVAGRLGGRPAEGLR